LESLLVEKGIVDPAALDVIVDYFEHKVSPRDGARVVARAWVDREFKQLFLTDAPAAIAQLGYTSVRGEHLKVVENTAKVHNLVVCTLCSCAALSRAQAVSPIFRASLVQTSAALRCHPLVRIAVCRQR
jgi:nitrile hydratase